VVASAAAGLAGATLAAEETEAKKAKADGKKGGGKKTKGAGKKAKGAGKRKNNKTQASANEKTTICHCPPGNPENCHTIRIGEKAAEQHRQQHPDDRPGPCDVTTTTAAPTTTTAAPTTTTAAPTTTTTSPPCVGGNPCTTNEDCCAQGETCVNGICSLAICEGRTCENFQACGADPACFCFVEAGGAGVCGNGFQCTCGVTCQTCQTSAECGAGSACVVNSCCGAAGVCIPICDAGASVSARRAVEGPTPGSR
jgi:hypothetical protein